MRLRTKYTERLPVAPGLRLDIPMFEGSGTKVLDVSGKGNHGTITDAVWTRDENGVAMSFNGTSAYIDCGNDSSLDITNAITIEAWVNYPSPCYSNISWHVLVTKDPLYFGGLYIDHRDNVGYIDWLGWGSTVNSSADYSGGWHHVVGVSDGVTASTGKKLYIDGVEVNSASASTQASNSEPVRIGGGLTNRYTQSAIDEVRIYAVALTAEQIKRRYEQTKRDYVRAS